MLFTFFLFSFFPVQSGFLTQAHIFIEKVYFGRKPLFLCVLKRNTVRQRRAAGGREGRREGGSCKTWGRKKLSSIWAFSSEIPVWECWGVKHSAAPLSHSIWSCWLQLPTREHRVLPGSPGLLGHWGDPKRSPDVLKGDQTSWQLRGSEESSLPPGPSCPTPG